jgi:hypothetical protein
MTTTPRRWFQIHLSTAVMLMFVSGGLIWANVEEVKRIGLTTRLGHVWTQGWPWYWAVGVSYDKGYNFDVYDLAKDTLIVLAILTAVAFACEWRIRRKKHTA